MGSDGPSSYIISIPISDISIKVGKISHCHNIHVYFISIIKGDALFYAESVLHANMVLGSEINFCQPAAGFTNNDCIQIDDDIQEVCVLPNPTTKDVILPKICQVYSSGVNLANNITAPQHSYPTLYKDTAVIDDNHDTEEIEIVKCVAPKVRQANHYSNNPSNTVTNSATNYNYTSADAESEDVDDIDLNSNDVIEMVYYRIPEY